MNRDSGYVDYDIREVIDDGFVLSKEAVGGLAKLEEYYASLPKTEYKRLKPWQVALSMAGVGLLLTSCVSAAPGGVENHSDIAPTIGPEINPELSFGVIPTAIAKESLSPGVYPTESYCSDDLRLCVFHQFDQEGKALAPRAYTNSQINFDLDNNTVVIMGDPLIQNDQEVWVYPPHDGQKGYETLQTMSVEEATAWMENMSETGRGNMQAVIDEARSKGVRINILMKTVLNVEKNAEGQDQLVDMIGGLALSSGEEGATIAQLNDTLDPLTENALLKDQQIAGVDFVPQFDGAEKLVMEVYPSTWSSNGEQWVSPEWYQVQEQVASAGERFTLAPDGTIQDGAIVVPGLFVDKNGVWRLTVGNQQVELKSAEVSFDDDKGINVVGYTLDQEIGKWGVERLIKEFPWCKDFSKFTDYPVAFEDLQEQGRFVQSTLTVDLFDPAKLNTAPMASMTVLRGASGTILVPNVETAPNYEDEATAPFKKEMMCGITEIDGEKYRVIQVPYYVEGRDPKEWPVITGVIYEDSNFKGTWAIGSEYFMNRMNVVPWEIDEDSIAIATQFTNPQTGKNFTTAEVNKIIGEMRQGNFANTNGLVLKFHIARSTKGWYE